MKAFKFESFTRFVADSFCSALSFAQKLRLQSRSPRLHLPQAAPGRRPPAAKEKPEDYSSGFFFFPSSVRLRLPASPPGKLEAWTNISLGYALKAYCHVWEYRCSGEKTDKSADAGENTAGCGLFGRKKV